MPLRSAHEPLVSFYPSYEKKSSSRQTKTRHFMNNAFCHHRNVQVFYFVSIIMFMSDFSSRNGLEIMQNILDDTIRDKSCKRFVEYSRTIMKCFDTVLGM